MNTRVVVVNFLLNSRDPQYLGYRELTAGAQIDRITKQIIRVCERLRVLHPDQNWVVVWPEQGIQQGDRYLTPNERQSLKAALMQLTSQYAELVIIAGTIRYAREYLVHENHQAIQEKMDDMRAGYAELAWLEAEETSSQWIGEEVKHHHQLLKILGEHPAASTTLVKNICYVFQGGKCVARHAKVAPFREVHDDNGLYRWNHFFQVGSGRSQSCLVEITLLTGEMLCVGIEICREHVLGVLQHELASSAEKKRPHIHFVLSDSTRILPDKLCGDYVIHADTRAGAFAGFNPESESRIELVPYQHDLLKYETGSVLLKQVHFTELFDMPEIRIRNQ